MCRRASRDAVACRETINGGTTVTINKSAPSVSDSAKCPLDSGARCVIPTSRLLANSGGVQCPCAALRLSRNDKKTFQSLCRRKSGKAQGPKSFFVQHMRDLIGSTFWARQTIESDIFLNKPDKWFKIWFFLVQMANYKDHKQFARGDCYVTGSEIMLNTGASPDQMKKCLTWLRRCNMVSTRRSTRGMTITINKYGHYQDLQENESTRRSTTKAPEKHQRSTTIQRNEEIEEMNSEPEPDLATPSAVADKGPNAINKVMEAFQMKINPTISYGNKTQRAAAQSLLTLLGSEKLMRTIEYVASIQNEQFAPTITTPYQLKEKMAQLTAYFNKKTASKNTIAIIS